MAAHFCPISRDEIHECLTALGFVPLSLTGVVELVYGRIVRIGEHRLSLRIYTAVDPDGTSRAIGTDAIRLRLFMRLEDGIIPVGRPLKCLRVMSWRENLRKAIDRVADPEHFRQCPACGNPMVVRRNTTTGEKFWGCGVFRITKCKGKRGNVPSSAQEGTPPIPTSPEELAPQD
jgi:hypothetical protein